MLSPAEFRKARQLVRLLKRVGTSPAEIRKRVKKNYDVSDADLRSLMQAAGLKGLGRTGTRGKWSKRTPGTAERKFMPESCFLAPGRKYPICRSGTRKKAVVDCLGARAAYNRARQQGDTKVAKKALRAMKKNGCPIGSAATKQAKRWSI